MKIGSLEITLNKQKHDEPWARSVTVPDSLQQTQPSIPLKRAFPNQAIGDSGTRMMKGIITQDYNSQLQGILGLRVYEEMRLGDATVKAAIQATTLPIRRAEWFIKPVSDSAQDVEIAETCSHAIFDWLEDMTFDDLVRQALISVPCGVMLFEKIYTTKEHEGKTYVVPKKLAPRLPQSIQQWELPDGTFGIQQIRQDGQVALIPGSKLLIFVNEREGDNWWGTPYLRACYKHWYYKNNFYKVESVAFERQGMGVPMITMPEGYTEADEIKAAQAMKNLRVNAEAYLVLPPEYKAEFMNMGAGTTMKADTAIQHHDKEILLAFLTQFLNLGSSKASSGSRALSQDHSDLFLKGLEAIADNFISVINKDLIPEMVDMNFDNVTVYPVLDYAGIIKQDVQAIGTALAALVTAGAFHPTVDDEQYIRAAMGFPARTQEQIDEAEDDDPDYEEEIDHEDDEETPGGDTDVETVVDATTDAPAENDDSQPEKPADAKSTKDAASANKSKNGKKPVKKQKHTHYLLPRTFDDGNGFKSWRPLTMAEQSVDFPKMEGKMNDHQSAFIKKATAAMQKSKDDLMAKLLKALQNNDTKAVTALEIAFIASYKSVIKDTLKTAYETGKTSAASEMGIASQPSTAETVASFETIADTIATKLAADIEAKAKLAAVNAMNTNQTPLQAAGQIDAAIDDTIDKSLAVTGGTIVGQGINLGRNDVFERNADEIYALQRSEILDQKTCNYCLSIDGDIFSLDDPMVSNTIFHTNCRGIWVQILKTETNPPAITGLSDGLEDLFGGQINDLQQPNKPIVTPGSAAAKEVAKRDAMKK